MVKRLICTTGLMLLVSASGTASASGHAGLLAQETADGAVAFGSCDSLGDCSYTTSGTGSDSGVLSGTLNFLEGGTLLASGAGSGSAVVQFTGTVQGCGAGTLVIAQVVSVAPATAQGTEAFTTAWHVVAGTGALAHVRGFGESNGVITFGIGANFSATESFYGVITCN